MVSAGFLFAAMSALVKLAARELPNAMVVFLRSSLGLMTVLPWFLARGIGAFSTKRIAEHFMRGLLGMGAMYCFFFAIGRLGLAEALLLNYSLPLFIPLLERTWLGAAIPRGIWRPIGLGLVGLVLILKPGTGIFQPVALIGILGAIFAAAAQVGVRGLTRTETVARIVFYFGVVSTLVSAGPAALVWTLPGIALWPILAGIAVSATVAQFLMTAAYQQAPASQVGPFIYTSIVFAGGFDWWMFRRMPDVFALCGAALIIVAGIATLREHRPILAATAGK
jgi:drug/metabolite transporter (DMT)-like permease